MMVKVTWIALLLQPAQPTASDSRVPTRIEFVADANEMRAVQDALDRGDQPHVDLAGWQIVAVNGAPSVPATSTAHRQRAAFVLTTLATTEASE